MNTTKKSLATVSIAAAALASLSVGFAPGASADTAVANKSFSKSFQQDCGTVGPFGAQTLGAVVSGTHPTAVKRGAAFKLTNAKIKVTVPAGLNSAAYASGARSQTVTFSVVNLNNTNVAPAVKDIIAKNITTARVNILPAQTTTFTAPKSGGLTAALKGGTKVGNGTLKSGAVKATFQLFDANGAKIGGPQPVVCGAENVVLTTLKIN